VTSDHLQPTPVPAAHLDGGARGLRRDAVW
jgi:hypothetical protein